MGAREAGICALANPGNYPDDWTTWATLAQVPLPVNEAKAIREGLTTALKAVWEAQATLRLVSTAVSPS